MNWSQVNIGQYQELHKTFEYKPVNDIEIADLGILQASIVKGEEYAETEEYLTLGELENIKKFIVSDIPSKIVKRFKLNGVKYEFELDPTKLKGGSYMSLMKDLEDPYQNMHRIIFNFAHPINWIGKRYNFKPEELHKRQEDFKQLPMDIANGLVVFFWNLSKVLTQDLEDSLNKNLKTMTKKTNQLAEDLKDGVG